MGSLTSHSINPFTLEGFSIEVNSSGVSVKSLRGTCGSERVKNTREFKKLGRLLHQKRFFKIKLCFRLSVYSWLVTVTLFERTKCPLACLARIIFVLRQRIRDLLLWLSLSLESQI